MPQYSNLKSYNDTRRVYHRHQADLIRLVHALQRLHVILFVNFSESCHISKQCLQTMHRLFGDQLNEIFIMKDLSSEANVELFPAFSGKSIPMFYSLKTRRQSNIFDNPDILLEQLADGPIATEEYHHVPKRESALKALNVHLYVMNGCGYCTKMKNMLQENGVLEDVTIISDIRNRPELKNVRGFPYMISKTTGKTHTGYVPKLETLIEKLSN